MRPILRALALASLPLAACAGYVAWGYGYCDPYYDPYCYDYLYDSWAPYSLAAEDFDGDGLFDLAVSDGLAGTVWLVRGEAGGAFAAVPSAALASAFPSSAIVGLRANDDLRPDLLMLDGNPGLLSVHLGDGTGSFTTVPPALNAALLPTVTRVARGLLDGDAFDDVVFLDQVGGLHVVLGQGDGTFVDVGQGDPAAAFLGPQAATRLAGIHLGLAEFDALAGTDLVVVDGQRSLIAVLSGNGDGTFAPARTLEFQPLGDVLSVAPVFVHGPAHADLAVLFCDVTDPAGIGMLGVVRLRDGTAAMDPMLVGSARALVARDLNGDGFTDLLLTDLSNLTVRALMFRRR